MTKKILKKTLFCVLGLVLMSVESKACSAVSEVNEPATVTENNEQTIEFKLGNCTVSDDKNLLQFDKIKEMHQQMYWTRDWSDEKIKKNIENSTLCYGVYDENDVQIGYARIVTNFSTVAYLLDVVVNEQFRGKGVGTKLMKSILENDKLKDCTFVLSTSAQAKKFYESLGFQIKNEKYMFCRVS